jgi:thiamine transport system ATP-binding protein
MTLRASGITVRFGPKVILDNVELTVDDGEIVALVGPSGSGKSTLLRVIAGLLRPDAGTISWDGDDVTNVAPYRRRIGLVFQDEQLFPHLDVAGNIGFGPRMARWPRRRIAERTGELLHLVRLDGFGARSIHELSGGEAKRVALARALATSPRVLLLDEPLTGLDRQLHDELVVELSAILRSINTTAIHVTHDLDEATAFADRVVTLDSLTRQVGNRTDG